MMIEDDLTLGPFYWDGAEILPCTTEATDAAIEQCMGTYRLISRMPGLAGKSIAVTPRLMTQFIQRDWDRVMGDEPDEGFLLAYLSSQKAVGRLAEQLICAELFKSDLLPQDKVRAVMPVKNAAGEGLLVPVKAGVRCDDQVVIGASGKQYLAEVKASFTGRSYLIRCLPKAISQIRESMRANPTVSGSFLVLASIAQKFVMLAAMSRGEVEAEAASCSASTLRQMLITGAQSIISSHRP